jgi:hypothetical protein
MAKSAAEVLIVDKTFKVVSVQVTEAEYRPDVHNCRTTRRIKCRDFAAYY